MSSIRIETKTLRQRVYDRLCEGIIQGEMYPGQVINLRELAGKFGVSIMPVREALWQLESENIIVIENNKRMSIKTLTSSDLMELNKIRLFMETELLIKGCEFQTPTLIVRLRSLYDKMTKVTSIKNYLDLNKNFHFSIYNIARLPVFLDFVRNLWLREAPYIARENALHQNNIQLKPHKKILDAFIEKDNEGLKDGLKNDLDGVLRHILSQLGEK